MKRFLLLAIFSLLSVGRVSAAEFLPRAHELFQPLVADPRDLQFATRIIAPVSHKLVGEAAMGDYLGIVRWSCPWTNAQGQLSIGGGVFARFDMAAKTKDFQVADFY